ncbi:hypothetical protein [Pseudoalteromonas maricaloris]|uniref:Acetyltransferase n=1 Tax=Pseudoalteromonas maricaloris TaxID=184924 RepID=A0ABZ0MG79_9GAMM|nr:hypothetical protein [Pseudoalteromonas maricaloris]WOX30825.1 hypothetical protein R5H13_23380 [Pseudoalteromonas maricaloris]
MIIRPATINDLTTLLDLEQQVVEAERPYNAAWLSWFYVCNTRASW